MIEARHLTRCKKINQGAYMTSASRAISFMVPVDLSTLGNVKQLLFSSFTAEVLTVNSLCYVHGDGLWFWLKLDLPIKQSQASMSEAHHLTRSKKINQGAYMTIASKATSFKVPVPPSTLLNFIRLLISCFTAGVLTVKSPRYGFVMCGDGMWFWLKLETPIKGYDHCTPVQDLFDNMNATILRFFPEVDSLLTTKRELGGFDVADLKKPTTVVERHHTERYALVSPENRVRFALHLAAATGNYKGVETELNKETCNVDLVNTSGDTPLLLAARKGHWSIVELLLQAGADINKADRNGDTALHFCLKETRTQSTRLQNVPTTRLMETVREIIQKLENSGVDERVQLACFLVQSGADIRHRNKNEKTPLDLAFSLGENEAKLLGFFAVRQRVADSANCRGCLKWPANTTFLPCGHCIYCDDCAKCMKRCLSCTAYIKERLPNCPSACSTLDNKETEVTQAEELKTTPAVYRMVRKPRGQCIIINNVDFCGTPDEKKAAELDVERMKSLFTQLHFEVAEKKNLGAGDMLLVFLRAADAKVQARADCFAVVLLTNGVNDIIYCADGHELSLREDVLPFFDDTNCPALKGKPKLFFLQCYREASSNHASKKVFHHLGDEHHSNTPDKWPDMFCVYATASGYFEAICRVFSKHAAETDLCGLSRQAENEFMKYFKGENPRVLCNGLKKSLCFNPV